MSGPKSPLTTAERTTPKGKEVPDPQPRHALATLDTGWKWPLPSWHEKGPSRGLIERQNGILSGDSQGAEHRSAAAGAEEPRYHS